MGGALAHGLPCGGAVVPQTDGGNGARRWACSKHHRGTTMDHYAGIDVSLECSSVCVVDANGRIVREGKVASEPEALTKWLASLGVDLAWIGLEARTAVAMAVRRAAGG